MPRTRRAANALLQFWIDEDSATTAITALERVLSGPSLVQFMKADVEPWLRMRARRRFANEGDEVVGQWAPLRPATHQYRRAQGFGEDHPINERTGHLLGLVTRGLNEIRSTPESAVIFMPGRGGTWLDKKKFRTAQQGSRGPRNTVARPVLALGTADLVHTLTDLSLYITEGVAGLMGMDTEIVD